MNELKDGLRRARRHYPPPPDAFERFTRRRERRQLVSRVTAAVVALALAVAAVGVLLFAYRGGANQTRPASQNAGTPGVNGKIAFAHMLDRVWHVYTINPDGSGETEVSTGGFAGWSPDGTKLVVDRGEQGIFVMSADGSDAVKIADAGDRPAPTARYSLDTGPAITPAFPEWSPDGRKILIAQWSNTPVVNYSRSDQKALGTSLLGIVAGSSHLFVVNADGTGKTQLTSGRVDDLAGSWSPDGTQVLFTRSAADGSGIYAMNADGTNIYQLISQPPGDPVSPPLWSPDGTQILFSQPTGYVPPGSTDGQPILGVFVANADGSNVRKLSPNHTYEDSPAWSPDGTKIVFDSGGIQIMNADGSDPVRITRSPTNPFDDFSSTSWGTSPTTTPSP